jgi:hypothetical protein
LRQRPFAQVCTEMPRRVRDSLMSADSLHSRSKFRISVRGSNFWKTFATKSKRQSDGRLICNASQGPRVGIDAGPGRTTHSCAISSRIQNSILTIGSRTSQDLITRNGDFLVRPGSRCPRIESPLPTVGRSPRRLSFTAIRIQLYPESSFHSPVYMEHSSTLRNPSQSLVIMTQL